MAAAAAAEREREEVWTHTRGAITLGIEVESWRDVMTLLWLDRIQVGDDGADYETTYFGAVTSASGQRGRPLSM